MLDGSHTAALVAQPAPGLPVARMVVGHSIEEVAALLPRLFNLCRSAQSAAVEAALGRQTSAAGISEEILRDHLLKFHVTWPAFFGLPPSPLPEDWRDGGPALRRMAFGRAGKAPRNWAECVAFLSGEEGYAPLLRKIGGCFAPGEAVAHGVSTVTENTLWTGALVDNSVAARQADHPAMRELAAKIGKGPLWRAFARLFDIETTLAGDLPSVQTPMPGEAIVPAARGTYGVRLETQAGVVTHLERITPTDHLLAEGGVLDRSLASLPADKAGLGPLLLDILDPCSPVRLREVSHA